jgi:RNA polymerase sigma-70 factor, ECF subfamily
VVKEGLKMAANGYAVAQDELAWVERAKLGEAAAFAAIYQRYQQRIYTYVYRHMKGNPDDAFDLTQETFIKAYRALSRLSGASELNLSAWLHRIAANTCIDMIRRRWLIRWLPWSYSPSEGLAEPANADHDSDPECSYVRRETRAEVQNTLRQMSARHRMALLLREYQGMSYDEIALALGVSRSAVKSTLFRAREEFRKLCGSGEGAVLRELW